VVTSATGVAVNVATDLMTEPWAWVGVAALTGLGVVVALKVQSTPVPQPTPQAPASHGGVHNSVSGTVHGPVIQTGSIGAYNDRSVDQRATAGDNSTIYQAGRDIRSDDAP
jgi:hypothetical protein